MTTYVSTGSGGWAIPAAREALSASPAELGATVGDITRFPVAHHGRRLDQTETACSAGASSIFAVADQLTWTRREHRLAMAVGDGVERYRPR